MALSFSSIATVLGKDVFGVTGLRPEQGGFQLAWIANAGRSAITPDQGRVHAEDVGHGWKVAIGHLASSRYRLRLADVGMALRDQASLSALTEDVVKTSEIEGEQLDVESVRSSIARRLGVDLGALAPADRHVEGVVEMVLDATANCDAPVTRERFSL